MSASETGEQIELDGPRVTRIHARDARACRTAVTGENNERQDCLKKKSSEDRRIVMLDPAAPPGSSW